MHPVHAGHALEQLRLEMLRGAVSGGGEIQLSRFGFRQGDQFLYLRSRDGRMHDEDALALTRDSDQD